MSFGADLRKIAAKRNLDLKKISRTVPLRIFSAVLRATRVDTGRLRGNWQVSTSVPALGVLDVVDEDEGKGLPAFQRKAVEPFALTYLSNNLPYAAVWEEEDAMIGLAVADFQRITKQEAAKI